MEVVMKDEMLEQLNKQINLEFYSAYFYLNMSNYYVAKNLDGFANWFLVQEKEERDHAFMFIQYLQDNDCEIKLMEIASSQKSFERYEEPLQVAYAHEKSVTKKIHDLYDMAFIQKDFRSMQFLDWFVKEQGEEEKSIKSINDKYNLFVCDQKSLYMLDSELKSRVYTPVTLSMI